MQVRQKKQLREICNVTLMSLKILINNSLITTSNESTKKGSLTNSMK